MTEDKLFVRQLIGVRTAIVVCQRRVITGAAITDIGLTRSSWTVLMQLYQLGSGVSVSELAQMQGIELPPLTCTLSQLEKQDYLLRSTSPHSKCTRLLTSTAQSRARLDGLNRMTETYRHRVTCIIPEAESVSFNTTLNQIACSLRTIHEGNDQR